MSVVVMGSAAVVVAMGAVDVNGEVIGVFEFAVDMMVPCVETVQRIIFWLLDGVRVRLWVMVMMGGNAFSRT